MINVYSDKSLTEAMLSSEYKDNGVVFRREVDAKAFLNKKGFVKMDGIYRGKHSKTARIYGIRDSILDKAWPHKPVDYITKGWLVSFGGEPRSCYELKFTKISQSQSII